MTDELTQLLSDKLVIGLAKKKVKGQFFSANAVDILQGLTTPVLLDNVVVIEPFVGRGDLVSYIRSNRAFRGRIECHDIDPSADLLEENTRTALGVEFTERDTLLNPPDYSNKFVLTNPPFLAGNKSKDKVTKQILNKYDTDDLFKCAVLSWTRGTQLPCGGMVILPIAFFLSLDGHCRSEFMKRFRVRRVNYFERQMFPDTSVCVVAFAFERSDTELSTQTVEWFRWENDTKKKEPLHHTFRMNAHHNWMVGGEIHDLQKSTLFGRVPAGGVCKSNFFRTDLYLKATDTAGGHIGQDIGVELRVEDFNLPEIKGTDRTFAVLSFKGRRLTRAEQERLCNRFNEFIQRRRSQYWSLWLPPFRDNGRHRLPFDTAYAILNHLHMYPEAE
jgi:hypothetical protein